MRLGLIAARSTRTNEALCAAASDPGWTELRPEQALEALRPGDAALGRLDVRRTLDGVDDGLWALGALEARGVTVLNHAAALLAMHDKLLTARLLRRHGIAHPWTAHIREGRAEPVCSGPVVLKPRFGSWGEDVHRCDDARSLEATLRDVRRRAWYREHGVLVQRLVEPQGYDIRIVVAAGRVVGAVNRIAAEGEWRTNVALGAVRRSLSEPPPQAVALALDAARVTGAALAGVDLLPDGHGGWVVLELNGAVEFTPDYAPHWDIYAESARTLRREAEGRLEGLPSALAS